MTIMIDKSSWNQNGYVVLKALFTTEELDRLGRALEIQCGKFAPAVPALRADWRSDAFHAGLLALRSERPSATGLIYDSLQTNAAAQTLAGKPELVEIAAALLDDEPGGLSTTGLMMRMDFPGDKRNRLHWHQERSYYPQNDNGLHGLVFWAPLQDADIEIGTIQICPGSHAEGFLAADLSGNPDNLTSEQYIVPDELVQRYRPTSIPVKAGDGVLFNFNVFHASGINTTDRIRFTFGTRFHRASAADFHVGKLQYILSHPREEPTARSAAVV